MSKSPKRRPAYDTAQPSFSFDVPTPAASDGALAGIEKKVASAVAQILKDEPRDRFSVAAGMSRLIDDEVSKWMLDKYASEASGEHNISAGRFFALIAETQRHDVLARLCALIGCQIVIGEEIYTVELGNIKAQQERLAARERELRKLAPEIVRGGARK
ncbi:hypothetical protein [Caulobacter soli]|uniref:hypothetical protein n=1 Tax=Caulobacter soli TaxID=2708539 RepID=UPI0013EE3D04|nr:hypothetical protein [Caulobacter soli]